MGKIKEGTGCAIVGIAYPIMGILGLVIHVWTIVIAFIASGLIGAVITLIFPVLAQIYWFIKVWNMAGSVMNMYCLAIIAYIVCWIIMIIGFSMIDSSS